MTAALRAPPDDVPTLTEVVRPSELAVPPDVPVAIRESPIDEERLTLQILGEVQARADALLEAGLRARLPPLLEQLVEGLLRELRAELSSGLAGVVREAVDRELARSRVS
ncbi:hypothetical protein [uncultured Sphaerotilus sp.]|uniref:hypothetical protein n=1 Tax=uncultured Sphaerotilus sp. TaxID=474984 RepID=UPI0030CA43A7